MKKTFREYLINESDSVESKAKKAFEVTGINTGSNSGFKVVGDGNYWIAMAKQNGKWTTLDSQDGSYENLSQAKLDKFLKDEGF